MDRSSNKHVLLGLLALAGKRVIDVGCGDGALVRLMAGQGARVTGVECSAAQLAAARRAEPAADETYVGGVAETLPFPDGCADVVVFFNSLHHVPVDHQPEAVAEAARVLAPEGRLYVAEPLAEGPHFEMMRPVHDETVERARAYAALKEAAGGPLAEVTELVYVNAAFHRDFDSFRTRMLRVNPEKTDDFARVEEVLRAGFETLGERADDGWAFEQPMRVNLLGKA